VGKADVILLYSILNATPFVRGWTNSTMYFNYRWSSYNEVLYVCILTTGFICHLNSAQLMAFEPSSDV